MSLTEPSRILPAPEFTVETYPGPISPRTYRQTMHNRIILERIVTENIDISTDPRLVACLRRREAACSGPGWDQAAETLIGWITAGDIDTLARVLLDPQDAFYHYRVLSPLITCLGTEADRRVVRAVVPRDKVKYA